MKVPNHHQPPTSHFDLLVGFTTSCTNHAGPTNHQRVRMTRWWLFPSWRPPPPTNDSLVGFPSSCTHHTGPIDHQRVKTTRWWVFLLPAPTMATPPTTLPHVDRYSLPASQDDSLVGFSPFLGPHSCMQHSKQSQKQFVQGRFVA